MGKGLTKAQSATLMFIRDNEPVKLFPVGGPSLQMAKKLVGMGMVETKAPAGFGFTRYLLTDLGRSALGEQP
jgi:hypothetical protein